MRPGLAWPGYWAAWRLSNLTWLYVMIRGLITSKMMATGSFETSGTICLATHRRWHESSLPHTHRHADSRPDTHPHAFTYTHTRTFTHTHTHSFTPRDTQTRRAVLIIPCNFVCCETRSLAVREQRNYISSYLQRGNGNRKVMAIDRGPDDLVTCSQFWCGSQMQVDELCGCVVCIGGNHLLLGWSWNLDMYVCTTRKE